MDRRTTIVLAIALLVLLAGSYVLSQRQQAEPTLPISDTGPWLQLTNGQIRSISILDTTSGQKLLANATAEGGWLLQSPSTGPADAQQLDAWLGQWQFMYAQHTITPTAGLDEFGLVAPTLVITFTDQSGQATIVHIGNSTPAVSGYYARQPGSGSNNQIAVIGKWPIDEARGFLSAPPLEPAATPTNIQPQGP